MVSVHRIDLGFLSLLLCLLLNQWQKQWNIDICFIYLLFFFFSEKMNLHQSDSKIETKMILPMGRSGFFRACLHGGGGPQVGGVTCGGSPRLTCKRDHIKMRDYTDRRVTSPTLGPPPSCKQALTRSFIEIIMYNDHFSNQNILVW